MLTVLLASAVAARPLGRVTALGGAVTAPADVLQLVFDLGQPAAQIGVLRLQVGDPLLQGGEMGQDGGLSLRRDPVPERCGDRRSSSHTLYYETSVQKVRRWDGSGRPNTPSSMRRTAYQLLSLGIRLTGTLGLLLDAKRAGLIPAVEPCLDHLQRLGFRISGHTRAVVLKLAGESP